MTGRTHTTVLAALLLATSGPAALAQALPPTPSVREMARMAIPQARVPGQVPGQPPTPSQTADPASTQTRSPVRPPGAPGPQRDHLGLLQGIVDSLSAPPGYVREVFTYPRFGRLDPVVPPAAIAAKDAFPQLTLSGILYNERDPGRSSAMLRFSTSSGAGASPHVTRQVVHAGDEIDQYTIVKIERTRVVIDMHLFGATKRISLDRDHPTTVVLPRPTP